MSIQICVITPTSHLKVYGALGEMDMSLSHLVLEDPTGSYARYYKEQRERGRFVILDNSAFELEQQGKGLDPDPVLDAAEITNPSEVIATDCLFDGPATIQSTKRFISRMRERGVLGRYKVMGVVQGRSRDEWLTCLSVLMDMPEVNTIGLSKLSVPMSFLGEKESDGCVARSRIECTKTIDRCYNDPFATWDSGEPKRLKEKDFHLLGGDNWTVWEMEQQVQYPWIRSNDSSCAVWYGRFRRTFNDEGKIEHIITDKPDLENRDVGTEKQLSTTEVRAAIMENIARWHKVCKR